MTQIALGRLTLPSVIVLIAFLSYGSQLLFASIEPHPLEFKQKAIFNFLIAGIWIAYFRACFVNPGWVPADWQSNPKTGKITDAKHRWCKKCEAYKPPRSHHCKSCARCIPKMDHHCPWTINCVSHRTFPHFVRFLSYSVSAMSYLEHLLFIRAAALWEGRHRPSYFGPSGTQMVSLMILLMTNSITLFAVGLLLARNFWSLGANVTIIEGWEIERHQSVVHKARKQGGYIDDPNGLRVRIVKQEFPFDIGIFKNLRQGMGGSPLFWLLPFALTPSNESGLSFETNGFGDALWPPPDPDRMPRHRAPVQRHEAFKFGQDNMTNEDQLLAFRQRQHEDLSRNDHGLTTATQGRDFKALTHATASDQHKTENLSWRDSEGEALGDFGVDEDVELNEDDIPLAELLRQRRLARANE